jgi:glutamate synthase (NADPH/NADH) large chain
VTAEYLNECERDRDQGRQGAKPGEGGQLPGFKVTELIARLRHSTPGVMLISPPPHHDIYSIEDLAQLIYDLKQINPTARVCVKLVAMSGIGTIAAGVAKAKADVILSPAMSAAPAPPRRPPSSMPAALGDGALRGQSGADPEQPAPPREAAHRRRPATGRDIVIAAMLGAEEFGIGTRRLIAMGCIMVRQCHSNTCPVGVCVQDERLRAKFTGTPEKVVNLFTFIAEEVREILASLGFRSSRSR